MRYLILSLSLLSTPALAADHLTSLMHAYDAVIPCAAKAVNLAPLQVDVSRKTGLFFGSTPAMYERCVAPQLERWGFRAPEISALEYAQTLQNLELAGFINELGLRIEKE